MVFSCWMCTGASARLAQRSEAGPNFVREHFRLFPGCKVPALVELVVVNELGVGALGPTPRSLVELFRKRADGYGNGNVLRREERKLALPVEPRRRHGCVRQPVE